ncbi:ABZJ_00895 family protein [Acinetobacter equi]|uniref:Uncharacterized protein n=1 Tax=Acinetobacter equi TaxID=1324350 RepID=A0A0N9WDD1_9GAMM|nr:ABZJ_00895 family protein [Acinetobacter equi]ALH95316.1 hypothetical protein AOY20_07085 [Acinetobacter equi]
MATLTRYFIWFFFLMFIFTCICGVLAALLPQGVGGILTVIPYMIAMIWVLFKFIKQQKRAPSQSERIKFTWGLNLIFWLFNVIFVFLGIFLFSKGDPEIWKIFVLYLKEPRFILTIGCLFLLIAIPLGLITYWFYGPQAQRMAQKIHS